MTPQISMKGRKPARGERLRFGARWKLVNMNGRGRQFPVTVLFSWNRGRERFAVISVRKLPGRTRGKEEIDFERFYSNAEIDEMGKGVRARRIGARK